MAFLKKILNHRKTFPLIWVIYLLLIFIVTAQQYTLGYFKDFGTGHLYTAYNNHLIFKNAFYHLLEGKNLYSLYLDEHWDLYKYSPAFALAYGLIAWMPDVVSLFIWTSVNAFGLLWALFHLPLPKVSKAMMALLIIPELLIALQNTQSNALMVALILLGWLNLEKGRQVGAAMAFVACGFIKIYGGLGFLLFLFYPNKKTFLIAAAGSTLFFTFVPLIVSDWNTLLYQYQQWWIMLMQDKASSTGLSMAGLLHLISDCRLLDSWVTLIGLLLLVLQTMWVFKHNREVQRLLWMGLLLIWLVIFNHKAESPTFIISLIGMALVILSMHKKWYQCLVAIGTVLFTSLAMGDLFPDQIRKEVFAPFMVKVWPSMILYFWGFINLIRGDNHIPLTTNSISKLSFKS